MIFIKRKLKKNLIRLNMIYKTIKQIKFGIKTAQLRVKW